MEKIVIVGAGAIGRGYLPWVVDVSRYDLVFVEANPEIVRQMRERRQYSTYRVANGSSYERRTVSHFDAYTPDQFIAADHTNAVAAFINVGPRASGIAARILENVNCPIILCENDPETVSRVRKSTGREQVYFAVPDVITSNTAPPHLLVSDPLAITTEDGVLFVDERAGLIQGDISLVGERELLQKQWLAKLYLHNTPHCIAAYLGAIAGVKYMHEAMEIPAVAAIVEGCMGEMLRTLKLTCAMPDEFLDWYAQKELSRFACTLLFDPIARVAREPLRKLEPDGRLIGAAQMCLTAGVSPENILTGIMGALMFESDSDPDRHLQFMRRAIAPGVFGTHVLGLRRGEALEEMLRTRADALTTHLHAVRDCCQLTVAA